MDLFDKLAHLGKLRCNIRHNIAAIDYQLNDPSIQMTDADKELFWRERVRLMKLLVGLRYAQAQRTGY